MNAVFTGRIDMDPRNREGYLDPTPYLALSGGLARRWYKVVYICFPSTGNAEEDTGIARRYCRYAFEAECTPLAPHLMFSQFMDGFDPHEKKVASKFGIILLSKCAELWWFGDRISPSMVGEIGYANRKRVPVIHIEDKSIVTALDGRQFVRQGGLCRGD